MEPAKAHSQTARNLRYSSFDAVNATPWSLMVLPGSFLAAGFLNALFEVGPFWFGLIAAMPAIADRSTQIWARTWTGAVAAGCLLALAAALPAKRRESCTGRSS